MRLIVKLLVFVLVAGTFQSCVSKKKYDELVSAKEATDQALAETQTQVKTLQGEKDALAADLEDTKTTLGAKITSIESDLNATKSQMAQVSEKLNMTEAELAKLKGQIDGIFATYNNSGLSLEEKGGQLYVVTSAPVKYSSGSSYVKKDARDALDALAEVLKANPAAKILVEGHTDNVPFKADVASDNWDLSYRRAKNVVKRLIKKGVDPSQLTIAGKGDTEPVADNKTSEGKASNRRTVIKPNPDLGVLKN